MLRPLWTSKLRAAADQEVACTACNTASVMVRLCLHGLWRQRHGLLSHAHALLYLTGQSPQVSASEQLQPQLQHQALVYACLSAQACGSAALQAQLCWAPCSHHYHPLHARRGVCSPSK